MCHGLTLMTAGLVVAACCSACDQADGSCCDHCHFPELQSLQGQCCSGQITGPATAATHCRKRSAQPEQVLFLCYT